MKFESKFNVDDEVYFFGSIDNCTEFCFGDGSITVIKIAAVASKFPPIQYEILSDNLWQGICPITSKLENMCLKPISLIIPEAQIASTKEELVELINYQAQKFLEMKEND